MDKKKKVTIITVIAILGFLFGLFFSPIGKILEYWIK